MKFLFIIAVVASVVMVAGCSRVEETPLFIVYQRGNEYEILDRGDTVDTGQPAYFVRYYSGDVADENVLLAERSDLNIIIAKYIDTNKHQRVVITAVERKGRLFGLMKPREISESLSVAEVLKR